jgi:hypothetical protein
VSAVDSHRWTISVADVGHLQTGSGFRALENRDGPLNLNKCWPLYVQSDISRRHEQKHFLHNRSSCRYRSRPQIARPVLGVGLARADSRGRTVFVAEAHRDDGKRFVVRADEKLTAFMELESAGRDAQP